MSIGLLFIAIANLFHLTNFHSHCSYLWPLIHYHKFLAKCIKKLKRNGVDVKVSVSPVALFLREEVCSVSDHLAHVSNFGSEQWMECLTTFNGWMDHDDRAESRMRALILKMAMRPLIERGDIESPLLRSQIDEQFLRLMIASREETESYIVNRIHKGPFHDDENAKVQPASTHISQSTRPGTSLHAKSRHAGYPPTHPKSGRSSMTTSQTRHTPTSAQSSHTHVEGPQSARSSKYGYYWPSWTPQYAFCDDGTSVESALSGDSYHYPHHGQEYNMYWNHTYYHHPTQLQMNPDNSLSHLNGPYLNIGPHDGASYLLPGHYHPHFNPNVAGNAHWYTPMGDPRMSFGPPPVEGTPTGALVDSNSPMRNGPYGDQNPHAPNSPFWGHLDYNTLAMSGAMTPQAKVPPTPPDRLPLGDEANEEEKKESPNHEESQTAAAQHMFDTTQYYPPPGFYGGTQGGFAPPSPATQFMMSPQANSQALAYYAYNNPNHYYMSPHRHGSRRKSPRKSQASLPKHVGTSDEHVHNASDSRVEPSLLSIACKSTEVDIRRESPVTVATETESVSAEEGEASLICSKS